MKRFACLCLLALPIVALVQEGDQSAARQRLRDYLMARKGWEERGITSSLSDGFVDVPFLDGYTPSRFAPLAEMPRAKGRGYFLTAPGGYEMDAVAFCLQAGTYRPSRGEGYLPGPLTGRAAPLIKEVLWNWSHHPEIPRSQVQHLIWSLEDRVDIRRLPQDLQPAARALLGDQGFKEAVAMARGPAPEFPDLADPKLTAEMERAAGSIRKTDPAAEREVESATKAVEELAARMEKGEMVDPAKMMAAVERLGRAQEKLMQPIAQDLGRLEEIAQRWQATLLDPDVLFEEVERAAILDGDPEPPPGSRDIPPGRWAFDPGGYFLRYLPEDHTRTRVELFLPPEFALRRDSRGRLTAVSGPAGDRLAISYDDAIGPLAVAGDPGTPGRPFAGFALGELRLSAPGSEAPFKAPAGWAFVGTPAGTGRAQDASPAFKGTAARYGESLERKDEVGRLLKSLPAGGAGSGSEADLIDLAHLAAALKPVAKSEAAAAALVLVMEAWQASVAPAAAATPEAAVFPEDMAGGAPHGPRSPHPSLPPSLAAARKGGGLPDFDPGKKGINPGNTARQRLGVGSTQDPLSIGKRAFKAAMKGCEFIQGLLDVFNGLTDPLTFIMEKFGLGSGGLPGMMLGEMINWIFDAAKVIAEALGGDPPRPDFTVFTLPDAPDLPRLEPGDGLSKARAEAGNEAALSLSGMFTALRAAQIAGDRLGGALQAGEEEWAGRQASAYVHYKRLAGQRMLDVADRYERLLDVLEAEGEKDRTVSASEYRAHLQALKTSGFRPRSIEAARKLGLGEAEIQAALERRLAMDPDEIPDEGVLTAGRGLVESLRALGAIWTRLPEDEEPGRYPETMKYPPGFHPLG